MVNGIHYIAGFIKHEKSLFDFLKAQVIWDDNMKSRKTASFGIPYNSSNISYKHKPVPSQIKMLFGEINRSIGFEPNNVLLNFYHTGTSKMGFHSDDITILDKNTGVVILSLGSSRIMRFKNKLTGQNVDQIIEPGSLIYLSRENQLNYKHSVLPTQNERSQRISVSFRKIVSANH